jgi:hypothetical protein
MFGRPAVVRNDPPIAKGDDAVSVGSSLRIVCDQNDRERAFPPETLESRHDLAAGLGVEGSGRLIRKQDQRIIDKGTRDRDALLLPA